MSTDLPTGIPAALELAEEVTDLLTDAMAVVRIASNAMGHGEERDSVQQESFENELIRVLSVVNAMLDRAADRGLSVQSALQRVQP